MGREFFGLFKLVSGAGLGVFGCAFVVFLIFFILTFGMILWKMFSM